MANVPNVGPLGELLEQSYGSVELSVLSSDILEHAIFWHKRESTNRNNQFSIVKQIIIISLNILGLKSWQKKVP